MSIINKNISFNTFIWSILVWIFFLPIRIIPLRKKQMVFHAFGGGSFCDYVCNPKYITERLIEQGVQNTVKLIWIKTSKTIIDDGCRNISWINSRNLFSIYYLMTSKVVVTNGSLVSWFPFRKKQFIVNTWHGGGSYKRVNTNISQKSVINRYRTLINNRNIDLFLSSSSFFSQNVIRNELNYHGEVLEIGMPRNDILVNPDFDRKNTIKMKLGIAKNIKIVFFAPTFRDFSKGPFLFNVDFIISALTNKFGGEWDFLFRSHKKGSNLFDFGKFHEFVDVSSYSDMQELLLITDFFITDYSSSIWDYSLLGRPGLLFVPDVEDYINTVGVWTPVESWPFDYCTSFQELINKIECYDFELGKSKIDLHLSNLHSFESGRATDVVVNRLIDKVGIYDNNM